jgi:alpha-1,2-mannosyltransferase
VSTHDVAVAELSYGGVRDAARKAAPLLFFGLLPASLLLLMLIGSVHHHFAFDFRQFWQGGRDVVQGQSPYPSRAALPDGGDPALGPVAIQEVFRFPYPAPAALLMAPFGLLPFAPAAALFVVLAIAAVVVALRVLGVEDWRCYGLTFASIVTLGAVRLGTFTPLLLLLVAVAWRYRDRRLVCAAAVAAAVVLKLFLWPLLVWLVISRRTWTALLAVALGVGATVVSWAALGFAGMASYPHLLGTLSASVQGKGWSPVALVLSFGGSAGSARAVALAAGAALLAAAVAVRRNEVLTFTLVLSAAVASTPIVWLHYFLLFLVPLALVSPSLSAAWAVPLLFWLSPFQETGGNAWRILVGLAAIACIWAVVLRRGPTTAVA